MDSSIGFSLHNRQDNHTKYINEQNNEGNETPTQNYYIPLPIQDSQSGHNTDSDYTETVTRTYFRIPLPF